MPTAPNNRLAISVGVNNAPQSRAIITEDKLPDGDEHSIGILLDGYDDVNNIKFTPSTQDGKQVWTPEADVVLSETAGTLYAYYPYKSGTDLSAIPVDVTAADQTDYLYATPVAEVDENNAKVNISMNHMLTNVNISIEKGTYVGTGNISSITIQSDGFATGGTFNAAQATPAFTAVTGTGDAITQAVNTTLGGTATNIMVVPTGSTKALTFTATIDNVDYTVTSSDVELEKGNSYEYTLSLNSTFMSIASVAVNPWTSVPKESLTLEKYVDTTPQIFAVKSDGSLIDVASADNSCVAVALIVNDVVDAEGNPNPQRLMIEKNGEANTTSIKAAYIADGARNTNYTYFYWGMYGSDNTSITNYTQTGGGGTSKTGYLPKADGTYVTTPHLSSDYTTWTSGALSDFNGKANTAALLEASDTDSYTDYANMATWCRIFNQTAIENQGYTDWYIPACGQLALMYLNMTDINNALTKIGGTTLNTVYHYLSSSECSSDDGWCVNFYGGPVYNGSKGLTSRVRFVRDF